MVKLYLSEKCLEVVKGLNDTDLIEVHNEYCERNYYDDDRIESMDCLDDYLSDLTPTEIINRYGDTDVNCDYFMFTIYGIEGFDYYEDAPTTYYEEIAKAVVFDEEDFGNSELRDFIEEMNEEIDSYDEEVEII